MIWVILIAFFLDLTWCQLDIFNPDFDINVNRKDLLRRRFGIYSKLNHFGFGLFGFIILVLNIAPLIACCISYMVELTAYIGVKLSELFKKLFYLDK